MGLLQLFGKGGLSEGRINKSAKLASNPFAQSDVRIREMQRLIDDGSDAALRGLLKRFAANANGQIADEDEKKWLEDKVATLGPSIVKPLQDYIRQEDKLSYALRAYERLLGKNAAVAYFLEVLEHYGPDDYRASEAKLQLVLQLVEHIDDERVLPRLVPFLRDHSDDVSWAVLDLFDRATDEGRLSDEARRALGDEIAPLVLDNSMGPRIQRRAAELLCKHEWQVGGDKKELAKLIGEDYFLDKKRFVRRRVKKS